MSNPKIVARIKPKQTISAKLTMHTQEIPPRTQKKTATPTTDVQTITFDEGYTGLSEVEIEAVTSSIDNNIQSENIKKNITILGVTGTVEALNAQTKNVTPSTSQQVITPDTQYNALSEVVISGVDSSIDNNIQSGNIKSGVEILGVTGSVVEKVGQNKTVTPSTSTQTIVPDTGFNALNQVEIEAIDTETKEVKSTTSQQTIYPSSGKFIDAVVVNPLDLEIKSVTPSTQSQTILPTSGKDGISQINVSAVDNTIDENIIASNIKKDVEILRNNWNVRRNRRLKYRISSTRYCISKSRNKNSTNDTSIGR